MPIWSGSPEPGGTRRRWRMSGGLAALVLLTACGTGGVPGASPPPPAPSSAGSASPSGSADSTTSPQGGTPTAASPSGTPVGTPTATGPSPTGSGSLTPTDSVSPSASGSGSAGAGGVAPVGCPAPTVARVERVDTLPRRTTEVVSVVSDGKNLTPGTREQSDFVLPTLQPPDGSSVSDVSTVSTAAAAVAASGKGRVLLSRPAPPDTDASPSQRPFNAPGTYVLYNASAPLTAALVVTCDGQEQRWSLLGETGPTEGQVNCAVEPPKSNALARQVYASNC